MSNMKKKKDIFQVFGLITFLGVAVAMVFAIVALSSNVADIGEALVSETPEAILASAEVNDGKNIALPVAYFDQKADKCVNLYDIETEKALFSRQFEWSSCGYDHKEIERGLVDSRLGEDNLPVGMGGELISNRGIADMTRWFKAVDGKSKAYAGTLDMIYEAESAEFTFQDEEFYPLDEIEFSADDSVNTDGHNHLFTMSFAMPFMALLSGEESFEITADDDTFVFFGNELVIDMGGIHEATSGALMIDESGKIYAGAGGDELAYSGIDVSKNENTIVRVFHADRDTTASVLKIRLSGVKLNLVSSKIADSGEDGVQVAYDPTDPSYVAPLGTSLIVNPDLKQGRIICGASRY